MLEPYQPAYNASVSPAPRTSSLPCPNLPGPSVSSGPAIQIPNPSNASIRRPKRIESLNSFRDNFREGYKDAYRYINLPSKPFASGIGGLGLRGMTSVRNIGSSTLGIGIVGACGPQLGLTGIGDYRRASSGSTLGMSINEIDGTFRNVSLMGSRSNSVGGSGTSLHQVAKTLMSSAHNLYSPTGSTDHKTICSPRATTPYSMDGWCAMPRHQNVTSITITNTEDEEEVSYHGSMEAVNGCNYGETFREGTSSGLRPLNSQMKVRSAVDLVTLVMQEKRNLMWDNSVESWVRDIEDRAIIVLWKYCSNIWIFDFQWPVWWNKKHGNTKKLES